MKLFNWLGSQSVELCRLGKVCLGILDIAIKETREMTKQIMVNIYT